MDEKTKKPFYKKWWFIAIVIIVVIGAIGSGGDEPEDVAEEPTEQADVTIDDVSEKAEAPEEVKEPAEETLENRLMPKKAYLKNINRHLKAHIYANGMHMSKAALYDQLVSEHGKLFRKSCSICCR